MKPKKTSARHRLITIVAFFVIMFFSCVAKNLPVTDAATTAATSSIQDQINANNQQLPTLTNKLRLIRQSSSRSEPIKKL